MNNKYYNISELEEITGLTRRTIHYYTKEKLIPPPDGIRGGAKYNNEHLLRLLLIKEMQKSHLKLSGIREALDAMKIKEMEILYKKAQTSKISSWDKDSIENWIINNSKQESGNSRSSYQSKQPEKITESRNYSLLNLGKNAKKQKQIKNTNYLKDLKRTATSDASWERFNVLDGVEINIRQDIMRKYGSIIEGWVAYLKKLV